MCFTRTRSPVRFRQVAVLFCWLFTTSIKYYCIARESNPGRKNGNLAWYHYTSNAYKLLSHPYSLSHSVHVDLSNKRFSTRMGFEPTRAEPIGLAVQRLNHSATSSLWHLRRKAQLFHSHLNQPRKKYFLSEVGFEPTPTEVDCDLNAAP